jgi:replicative DNA helicase
LRESGSIEQDADMVAFLYRADYYGITHNEAGDSTQGVAEVIIGKQRNGPTGTVELRFINEYTKFDDLDTLNRPAYPAPSGPRPGATQPAARIMMPSKMNNIEEMSGDFEEPLPF